MTTSTDDEKKPQAVSTAHDSTSAAAGVAGAPGQKLPKGMVLGPDGKPCRTCSDLSSFTSVKNSALFPSAKRTMPTDCPPDSAALGRASWTLLHSIAAKYPTTPTPAEQQDVRSFMGLFAKLYPCWYCAEDFQKYIKEKELRVSSRAEFGLWLCDAHNAVNRKLGKKEFDCTRWEERWRDGWKDGRCDF